MHPVRRSVLISLNYPDSHIRTSYMKFEHLIRLEDLGPGKLLFGGQV